MRPLLFGALLVLVGCQGKLTGSSAPPNVECTTPAVYTALNSTCGGCHGPGTNKPYFAKQRSFETLIVAKPEWVVPGHPDQSQLIAILEGKATGDLAQMPPGPTPFAVLASRGRTAVSMETLRCWIEGLGSGGVVIPAGPLPVARRLSAEQMVTALEQQLGISGASSGMGSMGLSLPDVIPNTDVYRQRDENYAAIGGSHWLEGRRRNDSVNPVFIQTFVNASQVACRLAVSQPSANNRILKFAAATDTSTAAPAKIRDNIKHLGRLLLSKNLSTEEVDEYFALFKDVETARSNPWASVCVAMVRDPLWLTY